MEFSFAAVSLEAINPTDHAFRISTTRDKPSIDESIRTDGLLVPPALYRQGADWIVISGFRRINACMQAGHRMVSARLLADHLSPLECLRLAIIENSSQRKLNLVESARVVRRLKRLCLTDQDLTSELARLGLPSTRKMIARLERINQLPGPLQAGVVDGVLSPDVALAIGALPVADQNVVHDLFSKIPMSVGKQRDILHLAQDIAGRDHQTVATVLHANSIRAIVDDRDRDRNMKSAEIRRHLRQVRYPNLSRAEMRFRTAIGKLKLGPHMRIDPPEGFEGQTYMLSLRFRTIEDLNLAHGKLGHAIKHPAITELFIE